MLCMTQESFGVNFCVSELSCGCHCVTLISSWVKLTVHWSICGMWKQIAFVSKVVRVYHESMVISWLGYFKKYLSQVSLVFEYLKVILSDSLGQSWKGLVRHHDGCRMIMYGSRLTNQFLLRIYKKISINVWQNRTLIWKGMEENMMSWPVIGQVPIIVHCY